MDNMCLFLKLEADLLDSVLAIPEKMTLQKRTNIRDIKVTEKSFLWIKGSELQTVSQRQGLDTRALVWSPTERWVWLEWGGSEREGVRWKPETRDKNPSRAFWVSWEDSVLTDKSTLTDEGRKWCVCVACPAFTCTVVSAVVRMRLLWATKDSRAKMCGREWPRQGKWINLDKRSKKTLWSWWWISQRLEEESKVRLN